MSELPRTLGAFDLPESKIEERLGEVAERIAALDAGGDRSAVLVVARELLALLEERSRQLVDYRLSLREKFGELVAIRRQLEAERAAIEPGLARLRQWESELEARETAVGLGPEQRAAMIAAAAQAQAVEADRRDGSGEREEALRQLEEDLVRREAVLLERRKGLDQREERLDALEARLAGDPGAALPRPPAPPEVLSPPAPFSREEKLEELARRKREALMRAQPPAAAAPAPAPETPAEPAGAPKPAADRFGELFSQLKVPGPSGRRPRKDW